LSSVQCEHIMKNLEINFPPTEVDLKIFKSENQLFPQDSIFLVYVDLYIRIVGKMMSIEDRSTLVAWVCCYCNRINITVHLCVEEN